MSCSRRRRSPSPANPHHARVAYIMDATVVALATRWSSCGWRPWVQRSLNATLLARTRFALKFSVLNLVLYVTSSLQQKFEKFRETLAGHFKSACGPHAAHVLDSTALIPPLYSLHHSQFRILIHPLLNTFPQTTTQNWLSGHFLEYSPRNS